MLLNVIWSVIVLFLVKIIITEEIGNGLINSTD